MGCVATIDFAKFPKQGNWLGKRVEVCFFYRSENTIGGLIVRNDHEEPWETIIKLDDGRYVRACECQHSGPRDK